MNHAAIFRRVAQIDVKGESIDEERNQESCEEAAREKEEGQVASSTGSNHEFC